MSIKKARPIDLQRPFDHAELMRHLFAMQELYPILEVSYLGTSVLDRGIPLVRLGKGRRKLLYVGAHHGMEWITATVLTRFLWEVCYAAQNDACVGHLHYRSVFDTHTIYVVPMLNPDGVDYQIHGVNEENPLYERLIAMNGGHHDFSHWQANGRGVDLNHNYDAGFEEYRTRAQEEGIPEGAPTRYAGPSPESEPEVHALCNLIRYHEDLLGVMTLHTQGREIYYQSGEDTPARAERIAQRLARLTSYKLSRATGLSAYGGLTDWCIRERGLPSFTIECGYGVNPLPYTQHLPIYTELREALFTFPILL